MVKIIKSLNLDEEIWDEIDIRKGEYGTRSAFMNGWLRKKLLK